MANKSASRHVHARASRTTVLRPLCSLKMHLQYCFVDSYWIHGHYYTACNKLHTSCGIEDWPSPETANSVETGELGLRLVYIAL